MSDNTLTHDTASIVAAYFQRHTVTPSEIPSIIGTVRTALAEVGAPLAPESVETLVPAVPVKKSIAPDHLVCLDCGKKLKMLKRHLANHHGLTVAAYRQKWHLAHDYPMTAPDYQAQRSEIAKANGLGKQL